ncbi:SSU ribosomal protein S1p [Dissulfuribacter thermophilus]|uniref:Small ribosomal subunit protein bS1 n=1 Tax=Dissulfuribacter thermophilus TaxID=1156395 RepID=A0A1B9F6J3_9BACT|nr:30S ribosomal protein S1 [Dissulfuribacter thermophilus]OCC15542.1 SSU ribosomal protein S1p [Dissulfuribacter thermophilus]
MEKLATDTQEKLTEQEENAQSAQNDEELVDMSQFEEYFEQSIPSYHPGQIIQGKVVRVGNETVLIDIGYKSEGQVPAREFIDEEDKVCVQPGDTIEVLLERWDPEEGQLRLSFVKALRRTLWNDVMEAYENGTPVKGKIVNRVKGGMSFQIGKRPASLLAFLPLSQLDLGPVKDPNDYLNQECECLIIKCNRKRQNIVVSRRILLEKEREAKRKETLATLEEGQVREGVVKNITDYGAFVDLGGIDGLLHVTDMSWGRVDHPSKLLKVGDTITVKVLSFDKEAGKVSLGIKQLTEDPWSRVDEKYPEGSKVTGSVVSLTDYGAFVELEEGVEGLIHVSEMSWTRKIRHPKQMLAVGDMVEAVVLKVDKDAKRISLGLKQVEPNPWDVVEERYPVGTVIEGTVKNVTDFGVFVGIAEGIDGLVHVSDLSWNKRIKHPKELYKKGQTIQAVVLNIDREKERFSLGVKQLTPDPWESVPEKFPVGSEVTGTITNVTDFGIFVELEEGIEGLIHVSEIGDKKVKSPVGLYEVGDEIKAKVINIAPVERRIGLSIKRLKEDEEKVLYEEYATKSKGAATTLGSLLQEELLQKGLKTE